MLFHVAVYWKCVAFMLQLYDYNAFMLQLYDYNKYPYSRVIKSSFKGLATFG